MGSKVSVLKIQNISSDNYIANTFRLNLGLNLEYSISKHISILQETDYSINLKNLKDNYLLNVKGGCSYNLDRTNKIQALTGYSFLMNNPNNTSNIIKNTKPLGLLVAIGYSRGIKNNEIAVQANFIGNSFFAIEIGYKLLLKFINLKK